MAYDLGNAYINIVPNAKGLGKGIEKELGGVGGRASKTMGGRLWGGLKAGAVGAGVAIGGVLAGSITKGFNRLRDIENAEAKLTGLGHSAESVASIMDNALAAVKGTSFGMGEAASLAGTLVASGIKPGEELEKTLRLTADSATIAGRELGDMGLIWGSVAAKGKLQGDDAMQLLESGVPIWQMVADVMGVTAAEAQELGSKGQVSFEVFREAMEEGVGGSALSAGKTTEGAFKNMGAAMGRFGATLLEEVYPAIAPLLGRVTEFFDYLSGVAGPAIDTMVTRFREWANSDRVQGLLSGLRDVGVELYERVLKPLGAWIMDNWKPIAAVVGGIVAAFAGGALIAAIGAVGAAIGSVFTVAGAVTAAIGAVVGGLTYFFTQTETGQAIFATAWAKIKSVAQGVAEWFTTVMWPALLDGWDYLKWAVAQTWPVIQSVFSAIGSFIHQVWVGVIQPALAQFAGFVRDTIMPIVSRLWTDYIQPAFLAIGALTQWLWFNAISPALTAIAGFIRNTLGPVVVWLWQNVVSPAFTLIGRAIAFAWNAIIFPVLGALKAFLTNVVGPAFVRLRDVVQRVWTAISAAVQRVVSWFQTWVWPVIRVVIELIKIGFAGLRDRLGSVFAFIRDRVIAPVVNWFRDTAWPRIRRVIDSIKSGFNTMRDVLGNAWSFVKDNVIAPVANWFRDKVGPLFDKVTGRIKDAFRGMRDSVKNAWNRIKETAKAPIRFVVDTVVNDGLIVNFNKVAKKLGVSTLPEVSAGFARGGVLPGMSRMRDGDDQLVPMRRGEGVLVSEGLRTRKDRAAFMAANAAGRRGVGFASLMGGGFAGGGILGKAKDFAGDALDRILDGADFVAEALANPGSIFTKLYDSIMGDIPGGGLMASLAKGGGSKLLSGVIEKAKGLVAPEVSMPDIGSVKAGGSLAMARGIATAMGLRMTSFRRPGARTAGSGSVSLHSQGRAMDFAGSSGQMMAYFNAMFPFRPTELLYSPAGGRNLHRGGGMYANTGATKRNHYDHVHVGFNRGGIFDQGGLMQPGMTGINLTKKPEAVLDPAQTRAYQAHAAAITGGGVDLSPGSIEALADALASRPNVLQIGNRQAGQLALAGAGASRSMGGRL